MAQLSVGSALKTLERASRIIIITKLLQRDPEQRIAFVTKLIGLVKF
jgi:hypothetical protein